MTSGYEFNDNEKALSCKLESLFKYYGLQINKYNSKGDGTELVRHFLIEPSNKGVKLKGA